MSVTGTTITSPLDNLAGKSQTTFSNAFSSIKMFEFQLKIHWSLFIRVQLTISQHWFRYWVGAEKAASYYLNQWWPSSLTHICGTKQVLTQWGWDNMAAISQMTFSTAFSWMKMYEMNENVWSFIRISLKFVPKVPIDNKPWLAQIMAWCQTGDKACRLFCAKPLSEPMKIRHH